MTRKSPSGNKTSPQGSTYDTSQSEVKIMSNPYKYGSGVEKTGQGPQQERVIINEDHRIDAFSAFSKGFENDFSYRNSKTSQSQDPQKDCITYTSCFIEKYTALTKFIIDPDFTDQSILSQLTGAEEGSNVSASQLKGSDYQAFLHTMEANVVMMQKLFEALSLEEIEKFDPQNTQLLINYVKEQIQIHYQESIQNLKGELGEDDPAYESETARIKSLYKELFRDCVLFVTHYKDSYDNFWHSIEEINKSRVVIEIPEDWQTNEQSFNSLITKIHKYIIDHKPSKYSVTTSDQTIYNYYKQCLDFLESYRIVKDFKENGLERIKTTQKQLAPYSLKTSDEFGAFLTDPPKLTSQSYITGSNTTPYQARFVDIAKKRSYEETPLPLSWHAPAGSGKTHMVKNVLLKLPEYKDKSILFITSVRSDIKENMGANVSVISYEDYKKILAQDRSTLTPEQQNILASECLIFDEFESQKIEDRKTLKEKTKDKLQIRLSATPNPYESIMKTARTLKKGTGEHAIPGKYDKYRSYQSDQNILLKKRNDISQNVIAASRQTIDLPRDIKGFQYFTKLEEGKSLSDKALKYASAKFPEKTLVVSYIDDDGIKKIKRGGNVAKPLSQYTPEEYQSDSRNEDIVFICCYDIARQDHIGVDFENLSKETTNQARVIDCDASDLNLSDWVQLYGRVRSVSKDITKTLESNSLPLIFTSEQTIDPTRFIDEDIALVNEQIERIILDKLKGQKNKADGQESFVTHTLIDKVVSNYFNPEASKEVFEQNFNALLGAMSSRISSQSNKLTKQGTLTTYKTEGMNKLLNQIAIHYQSDGLGYAKEIITRLKRDYGIIYTSNNQFKSIDPYNLRALIINSIASSPSLQTNVLKNIYSDNELEKAQAKEFFYEIQIQQLVEQREFLESLKTQGLNVQLNVLDRISKEILDEIEILDAKLKRHWQTAKASPEDLLSKTEEELVAEIAVLDTKIKLFNVSLGESPSLRDRFSHVSSVIYESRGLLSRQQAPTEKAAEQSPKKFSPHSLRARSKIRLPNIQYHSGKINLDIFLTNIQTSTPDEFQAHLQRLSDNGKQTLLTCLQNAQIIYRTLGEDIKAKFQKLEPPNFINFLEKLNITGEITREALNFLDQRDWIEFSKNISLFHPSTTQEKFGLLQYAIYQPLTTEFVRTIHEPPIIEEFKSYKLKEITELGFSQLSTEQNIRIQKLEDQARVAGEARDAATREAKQIRAQLERLRGTAEQNQEQADTILQLTEKLQEAEKARVQAEAQKLELDTARASLLSVERLNTSLQQEKKQQLKTIEGLQEDVESKQRALEDLKTLQQQELESLTREYQVNLQDLQGKAQLAEDQKAAATREAQQLRAQLETLRGTAERNQEQAERIEQLENQVEGLSGTAEQNELQADTIRQLTEKLREAEKEARKANEASILAANELATAKLQFDEQVAALNKRIQDISQASVELQRTNNQLVAEQEALRQQAEANAEKIGSLETLLDEKETALQELGKQNAVLQTRLSENNAEIERLRGTITAKGSAIEQENAALQDQLRALTITQDELKSQFKTKNSQIETLEGERDAAQQALADLQAKMQEQARLSQETILSLQGKIAEQGELIDRLTQKNQELREANQELQVQLQARQQEALKNQQEIQELRDENAGLNARNGALSNQLLTLQTTMQQLEEGARQAIIKAREEANQSVEEIQQKFEGVQKRLQEQITAKERERTENQKTLAANATNISSLETQNGKLAARVKELKQQLDASQEANQALQMASQEQRERAEQAEMALEDFKTTALQTKTALQTELEQKTAELQRLLAEKAQIDSSFELDVVTVASQSSGQGPSGGERQSIAQKIQALKSEIAGLREQNEYLRLASEAEQVKAQAQIDEQKRQTELATAITAAINAFDNSQLGQVTVDGQAAAEVSKSNDMSGYTTVEDLSSRGSAGSISEASIKDQIVKQLYDKFTTVDLQAQGLSRVDLSDISGITSANSSVEGGSQSTSRSDSPYNSDNEEEVTHPLDQFLYDQGLNGTVFAGLIKSAFDVKVAGISTFRRNEQEIGGLNRQLEEQREGHSREVQGLKRQLDAKSSELSIINQELAAQQTKFQQLQKKQTYDANRANTSAKPKQTDEKELEVLGRYENEKKKTRKLETQLAKLTEEFKILETRLREELANELQREKNSQKAEFEKQRNAYDIRVSQLEERLETSGSDNKKVKAEIAQLQKEMQAAKVQFQDNLQAAEKKYQDEITSMAQIQAEQLEALQKQAEEREAGLEKQLEEQRRAAATERDGLEQQLEEQRTAAEKAAEASQIENAALQEALQGLKAKLNESGVASEAQKKQITAQLAEIEELQSGNSSLQEANQQQRDQLLMQQAELESSIARLDLEKKGIESELEVSKAALVGKTQKLENAASMAERQGEEIQRLGDQNIELQSQIRKAQQQIRVAEQKAGVDQKQNDELVTNLQRLQGQLEQKQSQLQLAQLEKSQQDDEVRTLSDALEASKRENQVLTARNALLDTQIRSQTQQIQSLNDALGQAQSERDRALAANQVIREVVQQLTNQVSIQRLAAEFNAALFHQSLSKIQGDLERTNEELRAKSQELIRVKAELKQSQAELQQERLQNAALLERVSSLEQKVGEKTRAYEESRQEVVAQQREVRRLNQSRDQLIRNRDQSKAQLKDQGQEIQRLKDAQAHASEAAELARQGLEELQRQYDDLHAIRVQLAEANAGLEAQIQVLQIQNAADRETAAARQDAAVANEKLIASEKLREQSKQLQREKVDAVERVRGEAEAKLREQREEFQREKEGLVALQREAAQQHDEIIQRMEALIRHQTTQNRADTEAFRQQIVDMQRDHAAKTAQSRQENQLLQQQIMAANLAVAQEATKQVQIQTQAANDQRRTENQIRREELADRKAEREAKEQGERDREAKAEANTKNARDLAKIEEFKTSVETVGKKFTDALEKFQDLKTLSRDQLIKLTDPNSYDRGKLKLGEILGLETLRYINGYIEGKRDVLEYIGVKFPNTDPRDLSPENERELQSVVQKLERDISKVEQMYQPLTIENLQRQAKKILYLRGVNIDNNPESFIQTIADNAAELTSNFASQEVQSKVIDTVTNAISDLNSRQLRAQAGNIVKIFETMEPGSFVGFAAKNTSLFTKGDDQKLSYFYKAIVESTKKSNDVTELKSIMLKIKDPDELDDFIGMIPDNLKTQIAESDKSGKFLSQLLSRKSMDVATIAIMTELHDLVEIYADEEKIVHNLNRRADRDEIFAEKITAARFECEVKQRPSIEQDSNQVPLNPIESPKELKQEYSTLQMCGVAVGFGLAAMGAAYLAITLGAALPIAPIAIAGFGVGVVSAGLMSYRNSEIQDQNTKIKQVHSEFKEQEQQRSNFRDNGINYRDDHVQRYTERKNSRSGQNLGNGLH